MIIQTMNDQEKFYEAFRVVNKAKAIFDDVKDDVIERFHRGTRFPYYNRYAFEDNGNNWRIVFLCKSKEHKRKGLYYTFCYTTYIIEKPKKDINCGRGILWFDPVGITKYIQNPDSQNTGFGLICDITPHAFNRYKERFLKPKGLEIDFDKTVENMLCRWKWFDIIGDKSSRKYTQDVVSSYDVFMQGGGMLRGQILDGMSMRFFTYVSEDMYYSNQLQRQKDMFREYHRLKHEGVKI